MNLLINSIKFTNSYGVFIKLKFRTIANKDKIGVNLV